MNRDKLSVAVEEAKRFIKRAEMLPEPQPYSDDSHMVGYFYDNFPREQGAIRRASMDLTRALADLRRPC